MRKKIIVAVVCGLLVLLTACGHNHEWTEATCTNPRTCSKCGETEGEALGHQWKEATCTEPKKCSVCGEVEGEALGHQWEEATCTEPKKCSVCGEIEGEALGHSTDIGKCSKCGAVVNEDIILEFYNKVEAIKSPDSSVIDGYTVDELYFGCWQVYMETCENDKEYKKIIEQYKDYKGLSDMLSEIKKLIKAEPDEPEKTVDGINQFLDQMADYSLTVSDMHKAMANWLRSLID